MGYGAFALSSYGFHENRISKYQSSSFEPTGRANARPMTGSAKRSISPREEKNGLLRRLAPRNDDKTQLRDLAACFARGLACSFRPPRRGRRECRTLGASAAACAVVESTRVSHRGHAGNVRHSPRNGFNGFLRALPSDRACLPLSPLRSLLLKNLTPASGRQDHTTSPSAFSAFVQRAVGAPDAAASIASRVQRP